MIIVTGASRGLGQAIACRLKKNGKKVIGISRSTVQADIEGFECDICDYKALKSVVKTIKKSGEELEAVINVAGIAAMNMAITTDELTVQKVIQTNLIGTIYSCQLFAPLMIRQKKGIFINFSTVAVALALKGEAVYAASKAGVETFSRTFAREMADFNIRVNCIAPGPISTDLLKGISDKQIENITSQQIIQKKFEKSDICDLVELLIDCRASSISGQIINVGGI